MRKLLGLFFGAHAQVAVGAFFLLITAVQWYWWTFVHPASVNAVFQVSMEALFFGAYNLIATGLGYRATERVETAVVQNVEKAEEINVDD